MMQQGTQATNQAGNYEKHLSREGDVVLGQVSREVEFSKTQLEKATADLLLVTVPLQTGG